MDEEILGMDAEGMDAEDMTEDISPEDGAKITDEGASPENNPEITGNEASAEVISADEDPDEAPVEEENKGNVDPPEKDEEMPIIFPDDGEDDLVNDSADKLEPEPEQKPEQKPEEQPGEDNERIMEATTATVGFFAQLREAYQNGENIGHSLGNVLDKIKEISESRKAEKEGRKQAKIDAEKTAEAEKEERKKEAKKKAKEKAEEKAKTKAEKEKAKQDAIAKKAEAKLQKAEAKEDKKEAAKEVKRPDFDKLSAVDKVRVTHYTQLISAALKSKHIAIDDATIRSAIVLGVTSLVRDKENGLGHVIKNPDNSKKIIGAICKALTEELDLPMTGRIKFDKDTSLDLISEMDTLNQKINKMLEDPRQKIIKQEKAVEEAQRTVKEAEKELRAQQKALESAKKIRAKTIETDPEKKAALERRFDEVWDRLGEIESEYQKEHKGQRLGMLLSLEGVTVKETSEIKEYKKLEEEFKRINSQLGYGYEVHDEQIRLNWKTDDLNEAKRALTSAQGNLDFYHDQLNWFIAPNGNESAIEHIERLGLNSADTSAKSLTQDSALADDQSQNDGVATEQHEVNNNAQDSDSDDLEPASAATPVADESATYGQDGAELSDSTPDATPEPEPAPTPEEKHNDAPADATPSDPTPEATAEEVAPVVKAAAEESASAAEESASATPPADDKGQDGVAELPDPATPLDPTSAESASAAENQGQGQDDSETASAATDQSEGNNKEQKSNVPETMAKNGRDLTVNNAGSEAAAEEEAAKKAKTDAATTVEIQKSRRK